VPSSAAQSSYSPTERGRARPSELSPPHRTARPRNGNTGASHGGTFRSLERASERDMRGSRDKGQALARTAACLVRNRDGPGLRDQTKNHRDSSWLRFAEGSLRAVREVNPGTRGADGIEHDSLLGERREVPDVRRRESQRLHGDHSGPRGKVLPPAPYALHPDRREILLPNRAVLLMMGTTRESMEELSETNRKYSFISAKDKTANQTRWYVLVKTSIGRTDTLVAIATTYYWKRVGLDRDQRLEKAQRRIRD
jgi:hypothetical protein